MLSSFTQLTDSHGAPGTSNTAEAAIWAVDYILHAASIGIDRLYLSNGVGYRYNLLQPISGAPNDGLNLTDRPHILPIYHAFLFVNEAIGLNGKGRRIAEISTTDTSLAVYGIWEGEDLKRLVFINSEVYLPDQGKRGVIRVKPFVALSAQEKGATLRRLYTPYTSAYSGL